jgi:cell division protein FtsQ
LSQVEQRATGVRIDPRFRARRIEVQRASGRRRLRRLVELGLVLLVGLGFFGALRSPLLDVASIQVSGAHRSGVDAVVRASGIRTGEQLVDVPLGAASHRIAGLPWVHEVTVHRGLDGVVRITVTERTPTAVVGEGAAAVVVDATGRVVARAADVPDAVGALALAGRLADVAPGAIAVVTVGTDLTATLAQGGEVRFGDDSRLTAKLRSLETMLQQVDLTCLDHIDLRAPGNPVLTRREGCS